MGLPSPCFRGSEAGSFPHLYAAKHDPFIHYVDIRSNPARCHRIVPFSQLGSDLTHARLPRYAFISPDECFDMHSCPISVGDAWLATWAPRILGRLGPNGLPVVVFDEGSSGAGCCGMRISGGHVAAVIAGPGAGRGARIATAVDHYWLLRLVEDAWGSGACAMPLTARRTPSWVGGAPDTPLNTQIGGDCVRAAGETYERSRQSFKGSVTASQLLRC